MREIERPDRRHFLWTSGRVAATIGGLSFFDRLPRVSAAEAELSTGVVEYQRDIEPLVRVIEETPREKLLEEMGSRIKSGTSYQEILGALLFAGVRNVQPRPSVGFKFHTVLVVNSCHLASLHGPDQDRWLPIFWALDYFKSSQADEKRSSGWQMQAVDESKVPAPEKARAAFVQAMETWDEELADVATASLVRYAPMNEIFELFATYAARDFRSIGHKAIYLANAWRTLQVIGWNNAEPVLRSLAFALQNHEGDGNPAKADFAADQPWRETPQLAAKFAHNWQAGELNAQTTKQLIESFRTVDPNDAMSSAAEALASGVGAQSIWDAVFVGGGELLMRQPGIVALHGLTSANAIHYLYQNVSSDELRRRLLLQNCAFNCMFREAAQGRGNLNSVTYQSWTEQNNDAPHGIEEVIANISRNKMTASIQVREYLKEGGDAHGLIDEARRQVFLRGKNAHDYKYTSAVLEDFAHVSPGWRNDYLALSVFNLRGSEDRQSDLVDRTRVALS